LSSVKLLVNFWEKKKKKKKKKEKKREKDFVNIKQGEPL
jgi:hypothetical protein